MVFVLPLLVNQSTSVYEIYRISLTNILLKFLIQMESIYNLNRYHVDLTLFKLEKYLVTKATVSWSSNLVVHLTWQWLWKSH